MRLSRQRAFTLLELSIVMAILGLLTGSVIVGRTLIRNSELRAVISEGQRYIGALAMFNEKYDGLPGDISNATSYWGAQNSTHATCIALTSASTGVLTCDGNANGVIGPAATSAEHYELFRAWQQLSNAGFIEGRYAGVASSGNSTHSVPGVNVPRSRLRGAGWSFLGLGLNPNSALYFQTDYGSTLYFGAYVANNVTYGQILKAEEAYAIDSKMDDGFPHQGNILTYKNAYRSNCVVAAENAYDVGLTMPGCSLFFISGF